MKLIYCPICADIVKLRRQDTVCFWGSSGGTYLNNLDATYFGAAVPLGIANSTFAKAIRNQPEKGLGECFEAFVISQECPTFKLDKRE